MNTIISTLFLFLVLPRYTSVIYLNDMWEYRKKTRKFLKYLTPLHVLSIIRSQEKNLNHNRDSNLGPPDSSPALYHLSYPGSQASSCLNLPLETDATFTRHYLIERRARNPEVWGSNPGYGSNFSLEIL